MRVLILTAVVLAVASGSAGAQCFVTVGGNGVLSGTEIADLIDQYPIGGWTLCISPGVYELDPSDGWPVIIPEGGAPDIVGVDGAAATVLLGDGSMSAFSLEMGSEVRFEGITLRRFGQAITGDCWSHMEFVNGVVESCAMGLNACQYDAVVTGSTIRHNDDIGIVTAYYPVVTGNHVHDNGSHGISAIFGGTFEYNIVERNGGTGLGLYIGQQVMHNIVRENSIGVGVGEYSSAAVNWNDIYSNDEYEFAVTYPGGGTVDATNNWWGTTDPDEISARILDCADDPALGVCVLFDPWCELPGCDSGTPAEGTTWGSIKALYR